MVAARKAIESTYIGTCTITEHQKFQKPDKSMGFKDVVVLENIPCKLSFETITNTGSSETAATVIQRTKLFISPDITVKPGSKLTVNQYNVSTDYKQSGVPARYYSHQEIILELFEGWS